MRRALLFLLLFGGGLAILLLAAYLRDRGQAEDRPLQPPRYTTPPVTFPDPQAGPEGQIGVVLEGELEFTRYATERGVGGQRPRLFHVESPEVRPIESDVYDLRDLRVWMYDPASGELRATLFSPLTRTRVASVAGAPQFVEDDRVVFQDVRLDLVSGSDFVPAVLRVPRLEVDLAAREFRSAERVELNGRGLAAQGLGLLGTEEPYLLRLERDGEVDLTLPHGAHARLAAVGCGPLELRRLERLPADDEHAARDLVRVRVVRGARLDFIEEELIGVEADVLELRGFVLESDSFQVVAAYAEGGVMIERSEDRFRGERADFSFAPDGRLAGATLDGLPRGTLLVPDPERPDADPLRMEVQSQGRIEVDLLAQEGFTATGPTRIEVPEERFTLDARTRMVGALDRERGSGLFTATGAVRAVLDGRTFEGEELRVELEQAGAERWTLRAITRSPARLSGVDDRGRPVTVDVQAGAELRTVGRDLYLPLARQARIVVEGEEGFQLDAGEVRDLDWSARRFSASGGIVYRMGELVAVAREARTLEPRAGDPEPELELLAGPADPVRVDLPPPGLGDVRRANLRGQRVVLSRSHAVAEGRVHAEVEGELDSLILDAERIEVERLPDPEAPDSLYTPWRLRADDVIRGRIEGTFGRANFSAKTVRAAGQAVREREAERPDTILDYVEATGAVELEWRGEVDANARAERLVYEGHARRGRLEAAGDRKVEAFGRLPEGGSSYRLVADAVELEAGALQATGVRADLVDTGRPRNQHKAAQDPLLDRFSAEWMRAEPTAVAFSGRVVLEGRLATGVAWTLRAGDVWAELGEPEGVPQLVEPELPIRNLVAWNGFDLRYGEQVFGSGDLLEVRPERLRMEGSPARLDVGNLAWESRLIEYDPVRVLVSTEQGRVIAAAERFEGWTFEYDSLQPFEQPDSTIIAIRNPRLFQGEYEVRAAWALLWLDRDQWQATSSEWLFGASEPEDLRVPGIDEPAVAPAEPGETVNIFNRLDLSRIAPVLNELYLEGNIELLSAGERRASLSAAYFDLVDGHGWLEDAELYIDIDVRGQPGRVVVASQWLRHSADGSLQADSATVTTCTHEEPHFVVRTKNLKLVPDPKKEVVWDVSLKRNSLRFRNGWSLPLPPVSYPSDGRGLPVLPELRIGDSARFGQFLQATFTRELGEAGQVVGRALGAREDEPIEARARYSAGYLGSRGVAAGVGAEISAVDHFWLRAYLDLVYDTGDDKGLVRAPAEEREDFRSMLRARARMYLDPEEWLDIAIATQSDVGVQAEFYEGEFLEYEERDTYLHWRKASGPNYFSSSLKTRVNGFRNEVEELPSLGAFRGLAPLFETLGRPVYFRGSLDAAFLRRRQTDSLVFSPFDPVFDDGVTEDRTVQRVDGQARLELPLYVGRSGVTLTPFVAGRSTAWSAGLDPEDSPSRHTLLAGMSAATTFWRRNSSGWMHDITPRLGVRADLASDESGGTPLPIDATEESIAGTFVDADLRLRWWRPDTPRHLDVDFRLTHASDRPDGGDDGFLPVAVLGQFLTEIAGDPVGLAHDGRYDPDDGGTIFNRTSLGWEPHERLAFETGYARGVYEPQGTLYEAVSLATRYRATGSWELEGRQTLNLREGGSLDTHLLFRRYGHDLIFEFEISRRSGEGGTSFSIGLDPVLGWRRPRLGLLDRWLRP